MNQNRLWKGSNATGPTEVVENPRTCCTSSAPPNAAIAALANVAVTLHDVHFDVTREQVFTPSRQAEHVVDSLDRQVKLTYFYQAQYGQHPVTDRYPEEADHYGLKITHLVLPIEDHNLRAFNKLLWIQNDLITRHYAK